MTLQPPTSCTKNTYQLMIGMHASSLNCNVFFCNHKGGVCGIWNILANMQHTAHARITCAHGATKSGVRTHTLATGIPKWTLFHSCHCWCRKTCRRCTFLKNSDRAGCMLGVLRMLSDMTPRVFANDDNSSLRWPFWHKKRTSAGVVACHFREKIGAQRYYSH